MGLKISGPTQIFTQMCEGPHGSTDIKVFEHVLYMILQRSGYLLEHI